MKEKLVHFFIETFSFLPDEWVVIVISAMPILELRGGLPVAYGIYDFTFWKSYWLSVFGNVLPIIPLLLLFRPISNWFMRFNWYERMYTWLYERTMKKSGNVEKFGALGLILFTAVPLPTTGAYSACLAAAFFAIRFGYAFLSIVAGVLIAGIVMGILSFSIL
ncbi:ligand-binding protein SH3 [Pontibacillus halophilus JSM 076056 = DSM 19796]|uniref:Ligand-binding protein SH3 n=1 Tax=Pontibacillus halophilus JSM 076056 = DSM 19796 TaxID=1385510 RepID=A0A0A5GQV0_9BACI|nr:COG2426 family protein [Pontibacillus halophilus]KGX93510.1 ligand-binding protein SH3 [Pontibacillus halophilus JSM 076056 = DSM 19796]